MIAPFGESPRDLYVADRTIAEWQESACEACGLELIECDDVRGLGRSSCIDAVEGPLVCLERTEDCDAVNLAMQRLDTHHREILRLREFEGFDYRRIAESLHLTIGTVRSRISRARAQLRKELTTYWSAKPVRLSCHLMSNP